MGKTPKSESRFPPPWWIDEQRGCFVVRDDDGRALGYFYFDSDPGSRADTEGLREEEARRVATSFTKLPELVLRSPKQHRQQYNARSTWLGILFAIFLIVLLGSTLLPAGR